MEFIRAVEPKVEGRRVKGFVPLFKRQEIMSGFYEVFERDAFKDADMSDIDMTFNHGDVLGTTRSGLKVKVTDRGFEFEGDISETTVGNDTLEQLKRGDIRGCSFRLLTEDVSYEDEGRNTLSRITKVDKVLDVALVNRPAYTNSSIAITRMKEFKSKGNKEDKSGFQLSRAYDFIF